MGVVSKKYTNVALFRNKEKLTRIIQHFINYYWNGGRFLGSLTQEHCCSNGGRFLQVNYYWKKEK